MKNYARTLQDLQLLLLHERVPQLYASKQAAQIACNTVLPAQEPNFQVSNIVYIVISNGIFLKKSAVTDFERNVFKHKAGI